MDVTTEPEPNPYVALNNARNLARMSEIALADDAFQCFGTVAVPAGTVIDRPEGARLHAWHVVAARLCREVDARRASDRKHRRQRHAEAQ